MGATSKSQRVRLLEMTVCSSIPGLTVRLCLAGPTLVVGERPGGLGTGQEGPGIDMGRTKAGVITEFGGLSWSLKDSLGSVLPSSDLAWGRGKCSLYRNEAPPDTGFPSRTHALAKMAPWGLRKLTSPPSYPLLHLFLLACGSCPENMGIVCCPDLPRSHSTSSLPCLPCPSPVCPALASQPAAPWLLLKIPFTETEQDTDPRGQGSGNHRHGAFWSLGAWGGCTPSYTDE